MQPIGQILIEQTALTDQQLSDAIILQKNDRAKKRIGQHLITENLITETDLQKAIACQFHMPYLSTIPQDMFNKDLAARLPIEFLKKHKILPIGKPGQPPTIALSDPLNLTAFDAASKTLATNCRKALCPANVIEDGISQYYYHNEGSATEAITELNDNEDFTALSIASSAEDLLDLANRPPVVKLVNTIFYQAVQSRASDIHIEPYEQQVKVRFRVDGVMHNRLDIPKQYVAALISRLKIMANLNIAERRLPQDGRSKIKISDNSIDIRVSTIPSSDGERVVLRLLDKTTAHFGLAQIGFDPETEDQFRNLIHTPHGIVLLTGPTGSGKTTTLYGALGELNTEARNIMTVEDPIEYKLPGIGQMQVQPKIGLTFANYLRHILRQDPDIIMIGEIRDLETARIAVQAALTGHLVLSTLHTNDAASAVTRLIDMGIEPYLVCSSVIGIMAQRLVRTICPHCKTPATLSRDELNLLAGDNTLTGKQIYTGAGCPHCNQTGYTGREGIFELMTIDEQLKELILKNATSDKIKQAALSKGMKTLRQDGLRKVTAETTTIDEVLRVARQDA